jgi:hypothetical protein
MRATDIIRNVLDLIDSIDQPGAEVVVPVPAPADDELRRMQQIAGLQTAEPTCFANEPAEAYADVAAVTVNAGGGVNGPKQPSDMRSDSVSMYPDFQARARR